MDKDDLQPIIDKITRSLDQRDFKEMKTDALLTYLCGVKELQMRIRLSQQPKPKEENNE